MKHMGMHNARRHFMRNPRRAMRSLRPGQPHDTIDDSGDMGQTFGYFSGKQLNLSSSLYCPHKDEAKVNW